MNRLTFFAVLIGLSFFTSAARASKAFINADQVLVIDGQKVFPICYSMPPPINGRAPNGRNAIAELSDAGVNFLKVGPMGHDWDNTVLRDAKAACDAAKKYKMHTWVNLREYAAIDGKPPGDDQFLRKIITTLKDNPGLGAWKGEDEPAWAKAKLPPLERAYQIIHELDPNHPCIVIHAPRNTLDELRSYNHLAEIIGTDIYPIGYPPGANSHLPNKELSVVGDYTKRMVELAEGKKSIWMTLQIVWSGVERPGKPLRFPTFFEQRFMAYDAIINGARGLNYFGGTIQGGWNEQDKKLGWNWHFWNQAQRRVTEEIGTKSPLYPALVEPNSKLPLKIKVTPGSIEEDDNPSSGVAALSAVKENSEKQETLSASIEFCVREVGNNIFIIAAKKTKPATVKVQFSGLPLTARGGDMLFEEPRKVTLKDGKFTDWFSPFEVHVYRFQKM